MSKILYTQSNGNLAVINPIVDVNTAIQDVPVGVSYEIVSDLDIPSDITFFNAWEHDVSPAPEKVNTNIVKAKVIAHDIRRIARNELFKPLDINATIPSMSVAAEISRQSIRDSDAIIQSDIDLATDEATLKSILVNASYI